MSGVIGFTGRRTTMTIDQRDAVCSMVRHPTTLVVHHGDCVGADAQVHATALHAGKRVVVHPPEDPKARAFCDGDDVEILDEKPYYDRNADIVAAADRLVAAPESMSRMRSGTWMTIHLACEAGVPVTVVYPDGSVDHDYQWSS